MTNQRDILFVPGPVAMDAQSLKIGGEQPPYCRTAEFSDLMRDNARMLRALAGAGPEDNALFLTCSGTGAMEAAVINCYDARDRLLVIDGGTFGHRFTQICDVYGIPYTAIHLSPDEAFSPDMLTPYAGQGYTGMLVNACETGTGQVYDLNAIGAFCAGEGMTLTVDAISQFLVGPLNMRDMGIGALILSSQKGLALPPGLAAVILTQQVVQKRVMNLTPRSLYFNLKDYIKDADRGQTPYTPAIGILTQLHDRLSRISARGLQAFLNAAGQDAAYFREGLRATGFTVPQAYPLSNGVTPVRCPPGLPARSVVDALIARYRVFVAPNPGTLGDTTFRVSHMGGNLTRGDYDLLLSALKELEGAL